MRRFGMFSFGVCLSVAGCGDSGDPSKHVFLPKAEAQLQVSDGNFDNALDAFAKREGYLIERADYPKHTREVNHVEIYRDARKQTFLLLTNRKSPNIYECSAYSHEGNSWISMWEKFGRFARAQAGSGNFNEVTVDER